VIQLPGGGLFSVSLHALAGLFSGNTPASSWFVFRQHNIQKSDCFKVPWVKPEAGLFSDDITTRSRIVFMRHARQEPGCFQVTKPSVTGLISGDILGTRRSRIVSGGIIASSRIVFMQHNRQYSDFFG